MIAVCAQPPTGYYNSANNLSCAALKTALKNIISTGTPRTYGDLWTQYPLTDIKPRTVGTGSTNVIYDIYSAKPGSIDPYQFTPTTNQCGTYNSEADCYNREHSVPVSWFNGNTGSSGTATDYLFIFPTDGYVNGKRSNYIYGEVNSPSYTSQNGSKLGPSTSPGLTGTVFEPIDSFKGDVARAFLYFVTRYEDNIPTWSSNVDAAQAFDNSTFPSVKINYLKLMLKWHNLDPVSQKEKERNNGAYSFQGNRNPFIDSPQYVNKIWNSTCAGLAALPVNIVNFNGKLLTNSIVLNWQVENEINLNRYEIEKSNNAIDFYLINTIKANGSNTYTIKDVVDKNANKYIYYRIKKIENDGSYTYSSIVALQIPINTMFTIYPNPAHNYIQIVFAKNITDKIDAQLSDITGKQVLRYLLTNPNNQINIPITSLKNGTYILKLFVNNTTYVQKVVVLQ